METRIGGALGRIHAGGQDPASGEATRLLLALWDRSSGRARAANGIQVQEVSMTRRGMIGWRARLAVGLVTLKTND